MHVLDVGCGPDQMLTQILRRSLSTVPKQYVGVDLNPIKKKTGIAWAAVHDEFNFIERHKELMKQYGLFDVITNFEVIEHMPKAAGQRLLKAMATCLKPAGTLLLSTPVYNEKHMAANHIHEYREGELESCIVKAGLEVVRKHGTFMTSQAIKRVATKEERKLIDELSQFYCWDVLANFLAPKYPAAASNICWVLRRKS
jgi:2-polyprenyl-3-methyl-5-hydroxy-6-metoxy-1,4-benzoquinol methylase